jgi:hypothetical protein
MGALFLSAFLGAILGGIVTIIITVWVERLRSPTVRLDIGNCITIPPGGPIKTNWRSLRLAVSNEHLGWWANWWLSRLPAQQCRAEITFLRLDGTAFISDPMVGRWAGGSPEPRVVHVQQPGGQSVPYLMNPAELRNTIDIYPGEVELLDLAIRVDQEREAYAWNNETYFYENWRNPSRRLDQGRYTVKVVVTSSGRKCTDFFRIDNDGPFTSFQLEKLTPQQRRTVGN